MNHSEMPPTGVVYMSREEFMERLVVLKEVHAQDFIKEPSLEAFVSAFAMIDPEIVRDELVNKPESVDIDSEGPYMDFLATCSQMRHYLEKQCIKDEILVKEIEDRLSRLEKYLAGHPPKDTPILPGEFGTR